MSNNDASLAVQRKDFFQVPFFVVDLPTAPELQADLLLTADMVERGVEGLADPRPMVTRHGDLTASSRNLLAHDECPGVTKLRKLLTQVVAATVHGVNQHRWAASVRADDLVISYTSWMHVTQSGGSHSAHCHPNSAWSGIYTVQAGQTADGSGGVRFHNPAALVYHDPSTAFLDGMGWRAVDVTPVDGRLLLFPSFVIHEVLPYLGTEPRVTINFNMTFALPTVAGD